MFLMTMYFLSYYSLWCYLRRKMIEDLTATNEMILITNRFLVVICKKKSWIQSIEITRGNRKDLSRKLESWVTLNITFNAILFTKHNLFFFHLWSTMRKDVQAHDFSLTKKNIVKSTTSIQHPNRSWVIQLKRFSHNAKPPYHQHFTYNVNFM